MEEVEAPVDLEDQEDQEDQLEEEEVEDHLVVTPPPYLLHKLQPLHKIPQNRNQLEISPLHLKETEN